MNNQPQNRVKYSSKKVLKYCKYYRKGFCRFGDSCCFIHDTLVILPCPYGANCSHDDCWYSHSGPFFTSKIDDLINEVEELKKRLTLVENQKVCECHHCTEAVPFVGCTDRVWKDVEKFQSILLTNEQSFPPQTSAQKTCTELEEYTGTLEESSNYKPRQD